MGLKTWAFVCCLPEGADLSAERPHSTVFLWSCYLTSDLSPLLLLVTCLLPGALGLPLFIKFTGSWSRAIQVLTPLVESVNVRFYGTQALPRRARLACISKHH